MIAALSIFVFFHSTHDLHQLKKACSQQRSNAVRSMPVSYTHLNKNVIVIGGSGSGKTRFYVKPNLMQMTDHVSYVVRCG